MTLLYLPVVLLAVIYPFTLQLPTVGGTVIIVCGFAFAILHGIPRYGWRGMLALAVLCLGISFTLENTSISMGFPFGNYHYTSAGPHIGRVPIIVGPIYFAMAYVSWTVANAVLDIADTRTISRRDPVALPIAAAFVMVQWDVVMDPLESTVAKTWIWHDAGGYFGVPLTNYLGWFFTVWLFYQSFVLYLLRSRPQTASEAPLVASRAYWLAPILFYLVVAMCWSLPYLTLPDTVVQDARGTIWAARDIRETAVIILLFTMVPSGLFALYRTLSNRMLEQPKHDRLDGAAALRRRIDDGAIKSVRFISDRQLDVRMIRN